MYNSQSCQGNVIICIQSIQKRLSFARAFVTRVVISCSQFSSTPVQFLFSFDRRVEKTLMQTHLESRLQILINSHPELTPIFFYCRVFAMKSVQNLKYFWRSSPNYLFWLYSLVYTVSYLFKCIICRLRNIK